MGGLAYYEATGKEDFTVLFMIPQFRCNMRIGADFRSVPLASICQISSSTRFRSWILIS